MSLHQQDVIACCYHIFQNVFILTARFAAEIECLLT